MSKKLGRTKRTVEDAAFDDSVAHAHVPGRAYEITDPTQKLLTMIGGGFFNEPKYYDPNRTTSDFYTELLTTGKISTVCVDEMGLSAQAKEVIETAHAVANGDAPEDLLVIAAWARDPERGLKLRYTPQILFCIAAAETKTKKFVPRYATKVMRRADEILDVFAAFRHLFHKQENGRYVGAFPHALKKALALAISTKSTY
jgi:hypothetical protein